MVRCVRCVRCVRWILMPSLEIIAESVDNFFGRLSRACMGVHRLYWDSTDRTYSCLINSNSLTPSAPESCKTIGMTRFFALAFLYLYILLKALASNTLT